MTHYFRNSWAPAAYSQNHVCNPQHQAAGFEPGVGSMKFEASEDDLKDFS